MCHQKKHFLFYLFVLAITILSVACKSEGDWIVNDKKMADPPQDKAMPVELFKKNIEETDYSALVYLKRARVLRKPVWPLSYLSDYWLHLYEAEVIETFNGAEYKQISYTVAAEANIDPYLPNYPIILCLCGSIETGFNLPDNGYVSAASLLLMNFGREFKKGIKTQIDSQNICN